MAVACSLNSHGLWKDISRDPSSGVVLVREKLHLSLSPYYLANVKQSVKSVVDARLIRYNPEIGGILAGYERIAITNSTAPTLFNLSDVHVDVKGDFYIFKPEVGKELVGVVNKKNHGHVGCLVHGLFNVSLPLPPGTNTDQWIGKSAKLLDKVRFTITRVDLLSQVPFIQGNIVELIPHVQEGSFGTRVRASSDSGVSVASEGSPESELTIETTTEQKKSSKLSASQRKNEVNVLTPKVKNEHNDEGETIDVNTCEPAKRKRKKSEGLKIQEIPTKKKVKEEKGCTEVPKTSQDLTGDSSKKVISSENHSSQSPESPPLQKKNKSSRILPTSAKKLLSYEKKNSSSMNEVKSKDRSEKKRKVDKVAGSKEESNQENAIPKVLQLVQSKEKSAKKSKVAI